MSDEELDALFKRAAEQMLAYLDATVDTEARLAEVKRKAGEVRASRRDLAAVERIYNQAPTI